MRAARFRDFNLRFAAQVRKCLRLAVIALCGQKLLQIARNDYISSVHTGTRTQINQIVGRKNGLLIVFNDENRIANIAQMKQGFHEPCVIARVEPDSRLVKNIKRTDKPASKLGRETNALCLAARESVRAAVKR